MHGSQAGVEPCLIVGLQGRVYGIAMTLSVLEFQLRPPPEPLFERRLWSALLNLRTRLVM